MRHVEEEAGDGLAELGADDGGLGEELLLLLCAPFLLFMLVKSAFMEVINSVALVTIWEYFVCELCAELLLSPSALESFVKAFLTSLNVLPN